MPIILKSQSELAAMRRSGRISARAMAKLSESIRVGWTTADVDRLIEEEICKAGATPAFKGLYGFPASACVSVNEEVVHGIPGPRRLNDGDIVSVDIGSVVDGFCSDMAMTFIIGSVAPEVERLVRATEASLQAGITQCHVGNRLSDIGHAIQASAEGAGFSVVRDYVGHGIGRAMHEEPQVPNFGPAGYGPQLRAGMTLAIEPMINLGTWEVRQLPDGWTVVTRDRKPSAHFEHTVAITDDGPVILTSVE
jgi:methionyl aminopeptidase